MLLQVLFFLILIFLVIELNHHLMKESPLILKPKEFKKFIINSKQKYIALVELSNTHTKMEVMIPFFKVNPQIIGISKDALININTTYIIVVFTYNN